MSRAETCVGCVVNQVIPWTLPFSELSLGWGMFMVAKEAGVQSVVYEWVEEAV